MDFDEFVNRVDALIMDIKDSPLAPGLEKICIPGEIKLENFMRNKEKGIPLDDAVIDELKSLAEITGVPLNI